MNERNPSPEDVPHNEAELSQAEEDLAVDIVQSHVREEFHLHALASAQISFRGLQLIFEIGATNATETWKRLRSKDQAAEPPESAS